MKQTFWSRPVQWRWYFLGVLVFTLVGWLLSPSAPAELFVSYLVNHLICLIPGIPALFVLQVILHQRDKRRMNRPPAGDYQLQ